MAPSPVAIDRKLANAFKVGSALSSLEICQDFSEKRKAVALQKAFSHLPFSLLVLANKVPKLLLVPCAKEEFLFFLSFFEKNYFLMPLFLEAIRGITACIFFCAVSPTLQLCIPNGKGKKSFDFLTCFLCQRGNGIKILLCKNTSIFHVFKWKQAVLIFFV